MDRPGHARIKPPKAPPIWTGRSPLAVGADSISARGVCVAAGRADIESAPTEVCRAARLQFWKYPCFENAAKRPPALPRAGGAAFVFFLRVSRTPAPARRCGPKFRQGRRPFSGAGATKKWPLSKRPLFLEVTTRFELVNEGFADPCLTTWPRHHISEKPAWKPVIHCFSGAADEARTRYLHLGKVALYQMSYGRKICSLYEENIRETWCLRSESNQ